MRQRVDCPYLDVVHACWDGELSEAAAAEMQAHLTSCALCQAEQRDLESVAAALKKGDVDGSVPKAEHERLRLALLERCNQTLSAAGSQCLSPAGSRTKAACRRRLSVWDAAVSAVIVIALGAILFPVFTGAREKARRFASGPKIARRINTYLMDANNPPAGDATVPLADSQTQDYDSVRAERVRSAQEEISHEVRDAATVAAAARPVPFVAGHPSCKEANSQMRVLHGVSAPMEHLPAHRLIAGGYGGPRGVAGKVAYNPNAYLSSTYMGGEGSRDRIEKLIREGVMVQGRRVRLEAFPRSYSQAFPIPTRTALNLIANTERTKIVQEGGHTYLQVGLQAMKGEAPRRPPLNLALVIDCSGSMGDERKLEFAKAAALRLVDRLRPDDVLALIAFDDNARLLVPAAKLHNRAHVKAQIASLTPGSGTNIYEGLKLGHQQVRKYASPDAVNRVILLSDGEVTSGVTDLRQFEQLVASAVEHDVQTTTVGMGMDFNEELMLVVAREGKGNYHFLRDAADTQRVFAQELEELTHVVAKAIRLRIQLADGVGLVRVLGASTLNASEARQAKAEEKRIDRKVADELGIARNRQHEPDEPGLKLLIPSFYRGDHHVVMLELALPPGHGRRKVADVFLKYKDLVARTNRAVQSTVAVDYTPSREQMIASIDRNVKKNLLGFQTGEALADAAALIEQGKTADAVRKIDERMVVLGVAAREWGDRDLDRDGQLLDRYKTVLAQLHRQPQLASSVLGQYLKKSLTYAGYNLTR